MCSRSATSGRWPGGCTTRSPTIRARCDAPTQGSMRSRASARATSTSTSGPGRSRRRIAPVSGTKRSHCTRTSATRLTIAVAAPTPDTFDDRGAPPPYFAAHAYGTAGQIHASRGDVARSDQIVQILAPLMSPSSARLYPWLLRLHVLRGELSAARALERPTAWRVHATETYEAESELAWAIRDPNASDLADEMRRHAAETSAPSAEAFAWRAPR